MARLTGFVHGGTYTFGWVTNMLPGKTALIAAVILVSAALSAGAHPAAKSVATTNVSTQVAAGGAKQEPSLIARKAFDRFFALVASLRSTSDLTKDNVEAGMGITLTRGDGGFSYTSPAFSGGWNYGVERLDAGPHMKPGLTFGFYNNDTAAEPAPICLADIESVRSRLVSMGFDEAVTPGEIGGVVAWNFYKSDLVLTVIPGDLVFTSRRTECVRVIHTTDGM